jgi:hypothetical protein
MTGCAIHISDLHRGKQEASDVDDALVTLCHKLAPALVLATGDLSNRGRAAELARARALLDRLPSPTLAVPGNHDIAFRRASRGRGALSSRRSAREPVFGSDALVIAAESVPVAPPGRRPPREPGAWPRHLDGPRALRVVALHHHLAGRRGEHREAPLSTRRGARGWLLPAPSWSSAGTSTELRGRASRFEAVGTARHASSCCHGAGLRPPPAAAHRRGAGAARLSLG